MPAIWDPTRFYYSICKRRTKGFKSHSGLQRHETLKHISYNTIPSHVRPVSESELLHLKKVIIKELQKRLKNHHTAIGEQTFSLHCSEDAFFGVFKSHTLTCQKYPGSSKKWFLNCNISSSNDHQKMKHISLESSWQDASNGGIYMRLESIDEKIILKV